MKKTVDLFVDEIKIEDHMFLVERVRNLDDLVDQVSDELFAEDERLPYWAELWPSAQALAEYILQNRGIFTGRKVLELGCGLGLTTLALQKCNPGSLLATDYEEAALRQTEKNFRLNGYNSPQLILLDWRVPVLNEKYDLIVASDVAYEKRFFKPLIDLFKNYLNKGGQVILAEPNRSIARQFFGMLVLSGFVYYCVDKFVWQNQHKIKVSIYKIGFK